MGSENSINPCIKATLGPTFEILGGSGKTCFLGRFPIGEKGAPKSMDESVGRLLGGKLAHDGSAEGSTEGSDLAGWSLGLASRARGIE